MSDRLVRFPGQSWQLIEALPEPLRWTVQRTIFHLLDEPIPALADPFPADDPLPGAYELRRPDDAVTIWYTVILHDGQEIRTGLRTLLGTSTGRLVGPSSDADRGLSCRLLQSGYFPDAY